MILIIQNKSIGQIVDGKIYDVRCNIYDMAGNYLEWTTETSNNVEFPCVRQGGSYNGTDLYTSYRGYDKTTSTNIDYSFRPILYL